MGCQLTEVCDVFTVKLIRKTILQRVGPSPGQPESQP
jgi:hypothetical protein